MVLPTGDSIVFSATLNAATNQNEIAAILARGHAHMLLQHGREIHSEDTMSRIIRVVSVALVPSVVGLGYFVAGPWLRIQRERELDYVSMLLMAEAGFDPKAAASALHFGKRMSENNPYANPYHDVQPLIFYPPSRDRYQRNLQMVDEILQITSGQEIPASMTDDMHEPLQRLKSRWEAFKRNRPQTPATSPGIEKHPSETRR
ncbi:MAG: hypothetical protein Q9180_006430 [Flavoplaca navasiana]